MFLYSTFHRNCHVRPYRPLGWRKAHPSTAAATRLYSNGFQGAWNVVFLMFCSNVPGQILSRLPEFRSSPLLPAPAMCRASGLRSATTDQSAFGQCLALGCDRPRAFHRSFASRSVGCSDRCGTWCRLKLLSCATSSCCRRSFLVSHRSNPRLSSTQNSKLPRYFVECPGDCTLIAETRLTWSYES